MAITLFPDGRIQKNGLEIGAQQGSGLMHQSWYLTAQFTTSAVNSDNFVTGWAKLSPANVQYASIDTGEDMSVSGGVFTFPSTGIYEVVSKVSGSRSGGSNKYCNWRTFMSVDSGNTYNIRDQGSSCMTNFSGTNTINIYAPTILNITNASTTRLRFGTYGGNNNFSISAGGFGTTVTFRKLSVNTM